MPRGERARRLRAHVVAVAGTALLLSGCSLGHGSPTPTPSGTATPRPFTVMSTDQVRVTDPAAVTDTASAMLSLNVFQRLMTAAPGESVLKPDAARDCIFTSATTYTCTLNEKEFFSNGHPLTASDVKFSIERATRLKVPGSSAALLSSLRRIETPDPVTIRFQLSRPDTQFGWALASPAASIVDEEVYNPDRVQAPDEPIIGSGPFRVTSFEKNAISLQRYEHYLGRNPASLDALVYRSAPDSATIEDAMNAGATDVVWRGLDDAAVTRLGSQAAADGDDNTVNGYHQSVLTGTRVLQLVWSHSSRSRSDKGLRTAVALALQGDRTSDSVVPGGVPGHVATLRLGGRTNPKVTWKKRVQLTLGYDSTEPNGQDTAVQIRTRLENIGGLSVQLKPDTAGDLTLVDRKAWTATALAWLQPYLQAPLASSASAVAAAENAYQGQATLSAAEAAAADRLLATLQKQAATDLVVLPLTQSDEYVYTRIGVKMSATSYGPGWQLGLFGISRG